MVCFLSFAASTKSHMFYIEAFGINFTKCPSTYHRTLQLVERELLFADRLLKLSSGKLTRKQGPHQDVFLIEKTMVFLVSHVCHPTVTYHRLRAQKTSASFLAMSSPVGLVSCMTMANSIPSLKLAPSCTFTVHSSYSSVTYYRNL